ncbi:MAG: PH domain-containing protein [Woeseiaceae bacterium]|nr:PH domain-containing protein [Woeseiaceae bacterium]
MKTPDGWRRTSPLAVLFFLGRFLKGLTKNAFQTLAPLAAVAVTFQGSVLDKLLVGVAAAAVLSIIISVLGYLFFRFKIGEDSVLIREGIFTKKQLDIKFDRIQGVDTEQNFVYRWFNLVNIRFDTAGSSESEGFLPAVTSEFAEDLQERIDGRRKPMSTDSEPEAEGGVPEASPMLTLGWSDMVKIGLSDRRALIIFAVIGPFLEQLGDKANNVIANYVESAFDRVSEFGYAGGSLIVLAVILSIALLLALGSIGAAVLRYHNFVLTLDGTKLRSVGGLLTRHQVSMNVGKVQRIKMSQGIVLRWFGRFRLSAQQASSSDNQKESNSFKVPLVTQEFGERFSREVFAPEATNVSLNPEFESFAHISRRYVVSRTLMISLPVLAILGTPATFAAGPYAAVLLIIPVLVFLVARRYWRRFGYYHDNDALVRRTGLIGYSLQVFLFRKVQRVTVTQSWLQERKDLAGLKIFLASGSVRIPFMPIADANRLRDYILYKVESSRKAWH